FQEAPVSCQTCASLRKLPAPSQANIIPARRRRLADHEAKANADSRTHVSVPVVARIDAPIDHSRRRDIHNWRRRIDHSGSWIIPGSIVGRSVVGPYDRSWTMAELAGAQHASRYQRKCREKRRSDQFLKHDILLLSCQTMPC